MAAGLGDTMEQNAAEPRQVTADGVTAQQRSLPAQIAADKYPTVGEPHGLPEVHHGRDSVQQTVTH